MYKDTPSDRLLHMPSQHSRDGSRRIRDPTEQIENTYGEEELGED